MKHFVSLSMGKDSVAMLLYLLQEHRPIDACVFYDTGAEFDAIYNVRDEIRRRLAAVGIELVELQPREPFFFTMFAHHTHHHDGTESYGYGWCGGGCRWGTSAKTRAIQQYVNSQGDDAMVYVGIAADEAYRKPKEPYKLTPLIDAGMTERDCLDMCHAAGIYWMEGDVELYDVLDRVSCWCCRNKNLKELRAIKDKLPKYYDRLLSIERVTGMNMKAKGALDEILQDDNDAAQLALLEGGDTE